MWHGLIWARLLQAAYIPNGALRINQQRPVWQFDRRHSSRCSWLQLSSNLVCSALIMSGQIWSRPNTLARPGKLMVCFDAVWLEGMGCHLLTHWNINHSRKYGLKDDRDRVRRQRQMWAPVGFRSVGFGWSCCLRRLSCPLRSGVPPREVAAARRHQNGKTSWMREGGWREGTNKKKRIKRKAGRKEQSAKIKPSCLSF